MDEFFDFPPPIEEPNSGVGIASFVIGIVAMVGEFAAFAIAGAMEMSTPGGIDENSMEALWVGLAVLGGLFVAALGMALGIAAMMQRDRKKLFGILGFTINLFIFLAVILLMAAGMAMEG